MSALPYFYQTTLKIPPRWWSKRVMVRRIALDADFEVQEIRSRHSYDYDIQIWYGDQPVMKQPHHAVNVCVAFLIPYVCVKGSFIQVAVENYKTRLLANRVKLMFCGNRLYPEPGEE